MKKEPCRRGLAQFKKGCPKMLWDGENGCPNWITMVVPTQGNPLKKESISQCIDKWYFDFQWSMLGLLEGNQKATETFRNAMVQINPDTQKAEPRPDPAVVKLLNAVNENIRNTKKLIEAENKL